MTPAAKHHVVGISLLIGLLAGCGGTGEAPGGSAPATRDELEHPT
jgi:hypothetical protein